MSDATFLRKVLCVFEDGTSTIAFACQECGKLLFYRGQWHHCIPDLIPIDPETEPEIDCLGCGICVEVKLILSKVVHQVDLGYYNCPSA